MRIARTIRCSSCSEARHGARGRVRGAAAASRREIADLNGIPRNQADVAVAKTLDAIRGGAVIVRRRCNTSPGSGADVLLRTGGERPGFVVLRVIDTKLARDTRAGTVMQLGLSRPCSPTHRAKKRNGFTSSCPASPDAAQVPVSFRVDDYSAYFRLLQRELLRAAESILTSWPRHTIGACGALRCVAGRASAMTGATRSDHLSLVPGAGAGYIAATTSRHRALAGLAAMAIRCRSSRGRNRAGLRSRA
jgi:hypothetical protein